MDKEKVITQALLSIGSINVLWALIKSNGLDVSSSAAIKEFYRNMRN